MSEQLFDPGPPVCPVCSGRGWIYNRAGTQIPCPECGSKAGQAKTENAHDASEEWREKAEACVRYIARRQPTLTMDDIIATFTNHYPDLHTHGSREEKRRWGPLMRRMVKEGVIEHTGTFILSERRHRSPIPVWKSLLWNG
jgi:hypothetical protein